MKDTTTEFTLTAATPPPQQAYGPGGDVAVSGDEVGDSTVDEYGFGCVPGWVADPTAADLDQTAVEEPRIVQGRRRSSEEDLERTDAEIEGGFDGDREDDRSPRPASACQNDRGDRQNGKTDGLACDGIEDVLKEPDEVGLEEIEPSSIELVVPDSQWTGRSDCDDDEGDCQDPE
ncbi:hypothetical protein [Brevibacterium linens]|uniref:hypothetical protein n=1 Tax=Brevibacterium linens TaxID=1703 RepID=UPI000FCCB838|nr:hypothetical protein [Brevibacterium linens]AZU00338.1 hypothetical protein CXR29_06115 [Brevibacterium linens]